MKCVVCGYKYNEPKSTENRLEFVNDDITPFIKIEGDFKRNQNGYKSEVKLYACLKCDVVRIEMF